MKSTSKLVLPEPTYSLPDPSKKSHARKQPLGHVPRPRNAFILFRCDFVRQKKIPEAVENDHRNISRIVGRIWREMSDKEKEPWVKMAEQEKANHLRIHPGYRF
ncbi:high mobility group box domain-containing protein, partial [Flammula alnicola]